MNEQPIIPTFYLAGSWCERDRCAAVAYNIEKAKGWECTSRWLISREDDNDERAKELGALKCLKDIRMSGRLIVLLGDHTSLGKHVEIGAALQLGIPVHLVFAPWGSADLGSCAFFHLCKGPTSLEEFLS